MTIGLLWGSVTGQWETALGVSIFFELFWLDLFPAGTYIPPHGALTVFLTLGISHIMGLRSPSMVFPVLILSLPSAWLGAKLEHWQRGFQNRSYNQLMQWSRESQENFRPQALVKGSVLQIGCMNLVLFVSLALLLAVFFESFPRMTTTMPLWLGWPVLWMVGGIGGVLTLRVKRAYALVGIGAGCVFLLFWLL